MKIIYAVILVAFPAAVFSQSASKQEVMSSVRRVADNIVRNTTYLYYDKKTGDLITDLQKYGYNKNVVPQNGYNDWRYWNGVLHIGFDALGKETQERKYADYTQKNFDFFFRDLPYLKSVYDKADPRGAPLAGAVNITQLDDCGAIGASLIELYMINKEPGYKPYIDIAAGYISNKQMRLSDGTFSRPNPYYNTVWADDLYMSVSFLARMGKLTGDKKYFNDAANQVINFNKYLYDPNTGLMWHCYYDDLKKNGGAYWGRCNGWMMMATADLLQFLPADHPERDTVLSLLARQIMNIARYQSQSGLWHQVLNKEDSYPETSCTAMFTYAIALAVNNGWIDKRYGTIALAGWQGITTQITREGAITNTCMGTGIGDNIKFYYDRPTPYNDIHGLGPVLLAGTEVYKLMEVENIK